MRRQTGMVFQNFQLFPHRTALGNVIESLVTVLRWQEARARTRAMELLDKVGLAHKAEAWPSQLSLVASSSASPSPARSPPRRACCCADEPTSALDPELAEEVVEVLAQLAREGTTMPIATHDLRLAASVAQEAVLLDAGEIVEAGPSRELFTNPTQARTKRFIATLTNSLETDGSAI